MPTNNNMPEYFKRSIDDALHSDLKAAYDYVASVASTNETSPSLLWDGRALREAFLAGIRYKASDCNTRDDLLKYTIQAIRYRSLIIESLLVKLKVSEPRAQQIIKVCSVSADVIEHQSQFALDDINLENQNRILIQDLTSLLSQLEDFNDELSHSGLYIPSLDDINLLIKQIRSESLE
ncbi:hypothetical protein ACV1CZ_20095 [Aeromonas caviae]